MIEKLNQPLSSKTNNIISDTGLFVIMFLVMIMFTVTHGTSDKAIEVAEYNNEVVVQTARVATESEKIIELLTQDIKVLCKELETQNSLDKEDEMVHFCMDFLY